MDVGADGGIAPRGLGREGEQVVEAAREVPLEAAECSLLALALGFLARQVGAGGGVVASAGDGDDVQRVVSWRSPPRSSRWRWRWPEEHGIGAVPVWRAMLASLGNR